MMNDKLRNNATSLSIDEKVDLFLKQKVANLLQKSIDQIQTEINFFEMGLSSSGVVNLIRETERIVKNELSPTLLFEYITISEFSSFLRENYSTEFKRVKAEKRKKKKKIYKKSSINSLKQENVLIPYKREKRFVIGKTEENVFPFYRESIH